VAPAGLEIIAAVTLTVSFAKVPKNWLVTTADAVSYFATVSAAASIVSEGPRIAALAGLIEKTNNGASKTARII
jgi:hypothetical protein